MFLPGQVQISASDNLSMYYCECDVTINN